MTRLSFAAAAALALATAPQLVRAQPTAPLPLPTFPQVYETADQKIRVVKLADGLSNPWSMAWLPNGDLLLTERAGRLRVFHDGKLDPTPIAGVPEVRITALGGLLEVLPHPKFAQNALVYFSYSKGGEGNLSTTAVARGKLVGHEIQGIKDVFVAKNWSNSPTNFGGRMVFGKDGMLYLTVGERQEQERAQNTLEHGGKVLRLTDDGKAPPDNPFVGKAGLLAGDLLARSPQPAGARVSSGHRRALGERARAARRRRDQHRQGRQELRLAARDLRPRLRRQEDQRPRDAPRSRAAVHVLGAVDRDLRHDVLHGRQAQGVEGQRVRRLDDARAHEVAPATSAASRSATTACRFSASRSCASFASASATCGMGPDELLYVLTDENPGVLLRIEPAE